MTLVELLIAMAVLAVTFTAIAGGVVTGLDLARSNSRRVTAANLADERISEVRTTAFADISQGTTTGAVERAGITYAWTQRADLVVTDGVDRSCDAPAGATAANELSYLRVIVTVTWPRMGGIDPVRSETVLDPPVAAYNQSAGHLAVQVVDRDDQPVAGQSVHVTGGISRLDVTDDQGCVFFADLAVPSGEVVADYTVQLQRDGWVERASGVSAVSEQVRVVAGQLTKVAYSYDRGAGLEVTMAGEYGGNLVVAADGTPLPGGGLPIVISNDSYNSGTPRLFASPAALAAQPLYPFAAGFGVWAGACSDADPGVANRLRVASEPDTTASGQVSLATLDVQMYRFNEGSTSDLDEYALFTDQCANQYQSATATGPTGQLTVALPYGRWSVRNADSSKESFPAEVTLAPNAGAPGYVVVRRTASQ